MGNAVGGNGNQGIGCHLLHLVPGHAGAPELLVDLVGVDREDRRIAVLFQQGIDVLIMALVAVIKGQQDRLFGERNAGAQVGD